MSAVSVMLRGRLAAEALMVDTCRIDRPGAEYTDGVGNVTTVSTLIYAGKCKIQRPVRPASGRQMQVAEAAVYLARLELHIPMSATGVLSDDIVTITASIHDPDLVGQTFTVRQLAHKTFETARRLGLQEVTS